MTTTSSETLVAVLAELDRLRAIALALIERDVVTSPPEELDGLDADGQQLYGVLTVLRQAVFGHPAGARSMLALLAAEGRRYATTAEGKALRDELIASPAVGQLRRIWETMTFNVLAGPVGPSGVPDAWSELLCDAVVGASIDDLVARLRPTGLA